MLHTKSGAQPIEGTHWYRFFQEGTDFFKNSLNKVDLIRGFNEFMQREVSYLYLDYSLVITLEKEAWKILLTEVQNLSQNIMKEWTLALCTNAYYVQW